jgi:acylglycerol lipase
MNHSEGRFAGCKGISLYYQSWLPENKPKALILVVHGFGEHSGRYSNLVEYFLPRGYGVYAVDLRGHGRSAGLRGYSDRFANFVEELEKFREVVHCSHPALPGFLLGHSTGGTIAASYSIAYPDRFRGLVLSGALLSPPEDVPALTIFAARVLSRLAPKTGLYRIDANLISRDKRVVDEYIGDPLVYWGKVRARMGVELMDAMADIRRRVSEISLPVLILHGESDRISDPEGSRIVFGGVSSPDKTIKLYPGLFHEIFNEPERNLVLADMDEWLLKHR